MLNFLTKTRQVSPDPLVLIDIGAAGGLQKKWRRHLRMVRPVLFEPHPAEAARLRQALPDHSGALVVERGLAAATGSYTLNIAHWPGCTSLLEADEAVLAGYRIAPLYRTVSQVEVDCIRYDELHRAGEVPTPDAIKVDVEGYEHEVLRGFGDLLYGVLGIEVEAWLRPVFKGQHLLHDLVGLLARFGLNLRRIEPVDGFEGDLVCVNAYFTRGVAGRPRLNPMQQPKYDLLQRVWGLGHA